MNHGARQHATYGSSNAHRWLRCAAQVALSSSVPPRPDTEASEDGTAAHDLLQKSFVRSWAWRNDADPEMIAAVEAVHDWLEGLYVSRGSHLVLRVEQPVALPQSVVPAEEASGIPDLVVLDEQAHEAWFVEFKYGAGIVVEPEENAQLFYQATATLWRRPVLRAHFVVIQPRIPYHPRGIVRTWSCGPLELAEFQARANHAIWASEQVRNLSKHPGAWATPGPWCRYCAVEHACPARERAALTALGDPPPAPSQLRDLSLPDPKVLDMARVVHVLQHANSLRSWLDAVEKHARELALADVSIPGHKVVEAQARRRWAADIDVAAKLAEISGLPAGEFTRVEPVPITEAEKKIVSAARDQAPVGEKDKAAAEARKRMAFLTDKKTSGSLMLVPDSDPRPSASRASVAFRGVVVPPVPT